MTERVKRWLASCRVNRASRASKLERPNARRPRNLRIFSIFLRFVCRSWSVSEQRRSRSHSAKVVRKSNGKPIKNRSKSTKNRRKFHFRRFWALGTVSGTRWDALGTRPGRPKLASGPILERPGRAKSSPGPFKSVPGPVPRGSRTGPQRWPSAFGVSSAVKHDHGTIVGRFCIGARKLRCMFRISFYSVLLASSELRHERVRAAKNFEN